MFNDSGWFVLAGAASQTLGFRALGFRALGPRGFGGRRPRAFPLVAPGRQA